MIASAKSIDAGGVAVVYLVAIGPGLAVKASAPYWFDLVRYEKRLLVAALSMVGGFLLAGLGGRRPLQLLGVALTSFQSALGEATLLALAARHDEGCVSAWSSGTGFAGIVGYGWVWLFTRALRVSMAACQSVAALSLPLLYVLASKRLTTSGAGEIRPKRLGSFWERTRFGFKLWPTTGALFLVYFSEYALQSGVWASRSVWKATSELGHPIAPMQFRGHCRADGVEPLRHRADDIASTARGARSLLSTQVDGRAATHKKA